jgi:hypothetical protein
VRIGGVTLPMQQRDSEAPAVDVAAPSKNTPRLEVKYTFDAWQRTARVSLTGRLWHGLAGRGERLPGGCGTALPAPLSRRRRPKLAILDGSIDIRWQAHTRLHQSETGLILPYDILSAPPKGC